MKLVFIGPQGSGKGTQGKILSEELNIPHISTGELLRSAEGELREKIDSYINQGNLIPDELMTEILKQRLNREDAKNGFILDGFPRNLGQAKMLEAITEIDKAIEIKINDEESAKRLSARRTCENCKAGYNLVTAPKPANPEICDKCGGKLIKRADDNEEAIKKRLEIYHKETSPVLESYKEKLIAINGEQSIENVQKDILENLKIK